MLYNEKYISENLDVAGFSTSPKNSFCHWKVRQSSPACPEGGIPKAPKFFYIFSRKIHGKEQLLANFLKINLVKIIHMEYLLNWVFLRPEPLNLAKFYEFPLIIPLST